MVAPKTIRRAFRIGMAAGIFTGGFVCGSLTQQNADAQLKNLGGAAMKAAGGGALGSVGELGSSIVKMQEHVSGLQKKTLIH